MQEKVNLVLYLKDLTYRKERGRDVQGGGMVWARSWWFSVKCSVAEGDCWNTLCGTKWWRARLAQVMEDLDNQAEILELDSIWKLGKRQIQKIFKYSWLIYDSFFHFSIVQFMYNIIWYKRLLIFFLFLDCLFLVEV